MVSFSCLLRSNMTARRPIIRPETTDSRGKLGIPERRVVIVEELDERGYGGRISGVRGGCEKRKSRIKSPRMGEFSRTSGLESGLPSFLGSSRCPFRKISSMHLR